MSDLKIHNERVSVELSRKMLATVLRSHRGLSADVPLDSPTATAFAKVTVSAERIVPAYHAATHGILCHQVGNYGDN